MARGEMLGSGPMRGPRYYAGGSRTFDEGFGAPGGRRRRRSLSDESLEQATNLARRRLGLQNPSRGARRLGGFGPPARLPVRPGVLRNRVIGATRTMGKLRNTAARTATKMAGF